MFRILCLLLLCSPSFAQVPTWYRSPVNGHYYTLVKAGRDWRNDRVKAGWWLADFAVIRNATEQAWIEKQFPELKLGRARIGLTDEKEEGKWRWVDGDPSTYRNWCAGEPANVSGREDYAVIGPLVRCGPGRWTATPSDEDGVLYSLLETKAHPIAATMKKVGDGCPASDRRVPHLSCPPPQIGRQLGISCSRTLPNAATFLFVGFRELQLDLAGFGAPGCTLYATPHILLLLVTNSFGGWTLPWKIPADPRLAGTELWMQVFVHDPPTNALQLVGSDGLVVKLGYKLP